MSDGVNVRDGVAVRVIVAVGVREGVRVGVSVSVIVGGNVGDSGVNVDVVSGTVGDRNSNKAVWVNPAITVSAAAVLMAPGSCIGMAGTTQAGRTIDRAINAREIRLEYDMVPPKGYPPVTMHWTGVVHRAGRFMVPCPIISYLRLLIN